MTGVAKTSSLASALNTEATYEINKDKRMALTRPAYTLTPACTKEVYLSYHFDEGALTPGQNPVVPWINFNATSGDYEVFSDDIDVTGTHNILILASVKNYKRNIYAASTVSAI